MATSTTILPPARFALTIERLCFQLWENYGDFSDACMIGIQPRGIFMADRLYSRLEELMGPKPMPYGKLDITFYRDDFRIRPEPLRPSETDMEFLVEHKRVILVDDVLYTGRTIQAALTALNHYGRPDEVELAVLIDRRFRRQVPVKADYVGLRVDALDREYVRVRWADGDGKDEVVLFTDKAAAG